MPDVDLAIVGSGFGGSLLALAARRLGLRVALLERGRHPRFAIGESSSPLAGILIEQLADRYDLPRVKPLVAFGEWRRRYPDVVCGLKRGFTYFEHEAGRPYRPAGDRSNQLLVAASPNDEVSDTHWLRADVDAFLAREAIAAGAEYVDEVQLDRIDWQPSGGAVLGGVRRGGPVQVSARGVVDASGPRGFLSRALGIGEQTFERYPGTQTLFSHFAGVARCDEMPDYAGAGAAPPYPVDDAALHHVFDGGWMWVLRFGNGVTSAGVAVTDALADELRLADGAGAWPRVLERYPSVAAQFERAEPVREFTYAPRLAYRAASAAGPRWAMLPSAAGFVDPLFSTGFPLTLLGVERLSWLLETDAFFGEARASRPEAPPGAPSTLEDYSRMTLAEADHTARFVAGCYAAFPRFEEFVAYSMFYFTAASYAETARRLAPERTAAGFLRAGDEAFASAMCSLSPATRVPPDSDELARLVAQATEAINIAGLCQPAKHNWYGVDLEDTIDGAAKLGVTADAVRAMFAAQGL